MLVDFLEAENMAQVAALICRAGEYRTESRGAHYREDFPELTISRGGSMCSSTATSPPERPTSRRNPLPDTLDAGVYTY